MSTPATLVQVLDRPATLRPGHPATIDGGTMRTYAEVGRRVRGLGSGLARLGLGAGDIVGCLALNSAAHLEAWLGLPYHGLVLNDLNIRLSADELAFILDDSSSAALIVDPTHLALGRSLSGRCPKIRHLIVTGDDSAAGAAAWEDLVASPERPPAAVDGATVAMISYTGGTTGSPKGVTLTHGNLVANALHVLIAMGHTGDDRYLHAAPMFHSGDGLHTYAATWVGATHLFVPAFEPRSFTSVVEEHRATMTVLVPTMISMLVNDPATAERDLSSLRFVLYGASPMPLPLQRRAMELIPAEWAQGYGLTEAAPLVSFLTPDDHRMGLKGDEPYRRRLASAGRPVVGVEADVRGVDGTRCGTDVAGEIWVRGPNVMAGYWNRPDETKEVLTDDGWLRTGDIAVADEDGYLYIVDRRPDVIITGGENVFSTEVEQALYSHPAVREAAVFAVPDEKWGERVHAVVVLHEGESVSRRQLVGHCRERVARFKVPRSIEIAPAPLPKTAAGKIMKRELRAPFWVGKDRDVN